MLCFFTLRREFEICARQSLSRESITSETILAPCKTTVPTLLRRNSDRFAIYTFAMIWKEWKHQAIGDNDTWFCFKCATFNRSISGSLQKISVCFLAGQCLIDNVSTYRVHIWFHGWLLRRQNRVRICTYRWDRWDRNRIGIGIYGMDLHL